LLGIQRLSHRNAPPCKSRSVEVRLLRNPVDATVKLWTAVVYAGAAGAIALAVLVTLVFRRRHRRNEYQVRHDALTGLGNRTLLAEATAGQVGPDRPGTMLLLDLDGFKEVNDTLGHDAGDRLLVAVADRLELGCDEIQGYVLAPPVLPAAFDTWLDDWPSSHDKPAVTAQLSHQAAAPIGEPDAYHRRHSAISSTILSVIRDTVSFDTDAP
jgi:hypothetical protein